MRHSFLPSFLPLDGLMDEFRWMDGWMSSVGKLEFFFYFVASARSRACLARRV